MQTLRAMTFSDFRQPLSECLIVDGAGKERLTQGAKIKAGATNKDREVTASFDFGNCLDCRTRPIGRGESHLRRNKIDEMMWNCRDAQRAGLSQSRFQSADKPGRNRS